MSTAKFAAPRLSTFAAGQDMAADAVPEPVAAPAMPANRGAAHSTAFPLVVRRCDSLAEEDILFDPEATVWKASRFVGVPRFYPVYQYDDYFSFSPFPLILLKKRVDVNDGYLRAIARRELTHGLYYSGSETIDRDIRRIGGPAAHHPTVTDPGVAASRVAAAIAADIEEVEEALPGARHVVLCGGKDSLNLLLAPWTRPVLALSARPNYPLVQQFIAANGLDIECMELTDDDTSTIQEEIVYNTCLLDLRHCRWTGDLRRIADARPNTVFWKGQIGDLFLTPFWRSYAHHEPPRPPWAAGPVTALLMKLGVRGPAEAQQRRVFSDLWRRAAMMQGTHMGLIRGVCKCPVLSGYHGAHVQRELADIDLVSAVSSDIRPLVGRALFGRSVVYPATNPSPPPSAIRSHLSTPAVWFAAARGLGLPIALQPAQSLQL